jgi:AraC-like DNA-binding protein
LDQAVYDPAVRVLLCRMQRLVEWSFADLSAPYWRFYWNDRAGASVALGGRATPLVPARFALIPPNTPFAARLARPAVHFYIHFTAAAPYDTVAPAIFTFPMTAELRGSIRELAGMMHDGGLVGGPRPALLAHALAAAALSRLPPERLPAVRRDERVEAAMRLMDERLSDPPANAELAERAGMNANAFIRLFQRVAGRSPQAWLTARRIERACLLLQGGELGIKEIAAACGFCDRYHLSRVFKRLRGVGPAEFRRRCY